MAVALLFLLVAVQMATTLNDVFHEQEFDVRNATHLALLCSLLAQGALILQTALAAADVVYASERLAELLASLETSLQVVAGSSAAEYVQLCRAFGARVRFHPIRLRFSWFHFNVQWALGWCALLLTILLAVVGVKIPGGVD